MKINFERIDNKTPFRVAFTDMFTSQKDPSFWVNCDAAFNPKTKAAAKGFVFTDKEAAIEIVCRLIAHIIGRWPDTFTVFYKHISSYESQSNKGEK